MIVTVQQLCSVSKGKHGTGRGDDSGGMGRVEGLEEGGRSCREGGGGLGLGFRSPSNLRHLTAAWNMEAWVPAVELNATPRTDRGDRQG